MPLEAYSLWRRLGKDINYAFYCNEASLKTCFSVAFCGITLVHHSHLLHLSLPYCVVGRSRL
jgi:hypothetical protein